MSEVDEPMESPHLGGGKICCKGAVFSPDGKYLIAAGFGAVRVYSATTGQRVGSLSEKVVSVAVHPEDKSTVSLGHTKFPFLLVLHVNCSLSLLESGIPCVSLYCKQQTSFNGRNCIQKQRKLHDMVLGGDDGSCASVMISKQCKF